MNENHKNHKLMWNELARTGEDKKDVVIDRLRLPEARFCCHACESTIIHGRQEDCIVCPIRWGDGGNYYHSCTDSEKSPYAKWVETESVETRKKYAKIIANMKWRTKK